MNTLTTILTLLGRVLADWLLLGARVRKVLDNDLPHLETAQRETRELLEQQIGYCRGYCLGRLDAGELTPPAEPDSQTAPPPPPPPPRR